MKNGINIHEEYEKEKNIKVMNETFDKNQRKWIMFEFHDSINSIEAVMIECCNYYKTKNNEQFDISLFSVQLTKFISYFFFLPLSPYNIV